MIKINFKTFSPFGMGCGENQFISSNEIFSPMELKSGSVYGDVFKAIEEVCNLYGTSFDGCAFIIGSSLLGYDISLKEEIKDDKSIFVIPMSKDNRSIRLPYKNYKNGQD